MIFFQFLCLMAFLSLIFLLPGYLWEKALDDRAAREGKIRVWRGWRMVKVPLPQSRGCRPPDPPDGPEPPVIHPPENKPYPWRPWS